MKLKYYILLLILLSIQFSIKAQGKLEGKVFDISDKDHYGLPGANVFWAGTTTGTSTNAAGYFSLKRVRGKNKLVISFIGYRTDTITVGEKEEYLKYGLEQQNEIGEIVITGRASGTHIDKLDPILTMNITGAELRKAACCNLSESFETNASVDVNYTDAATGAKQIQLLGLSGTYTQILAENIPTLYGIATAYGLNYIPGPWMESIQVSKGTSSVRNGYESIAGQINVEYKKPAESEKIYLNGFISDAGRQELNANGSLLINDKLSTMIMAHAERQKGMNDKNHDGFRDEPDLKQYHFFNRWDYLTAKGDIRAGVKYLEEERIGGQYSYNPGNPDTWSNGFGINIKTKRFEAFTKTGRVFMNDNSMSVGWINNYSYHDQNSFYGYRQYNGKQNAFYSNLLYQYNPNLGNHTIDAGVNYKYDQYDESLDATPYKRFESVPGIFMQYTYADTSRITVVAGVRADFHNVYGTFITPRIHLRYVLAPRVILRASAGKGYRSANVLAENSYLLASSRAMIISSNLKEEEAVNYGASLNARIPVSGKEIRVTAEAFRTNFINQVITDLDASVNEVKFYNLEGKSYSNVYQLEASTQILNGLDLLAAWRWNDVQMTIDGQLRTKPLASKYKGLLTASYLTRLRKWQFDYTLQLNGPGRVPSTAENPDPYKRDDNFKAFTVMNAQGTRYFKNFHLYIGAENLLDYMQHNPIIAADDPFGEYFDSGLIWGPVHGRKIYAGFRFMINREINN
jgi:outer membrane receptor for ferrienterochelin and colicin